MLTGKHQKESRVKKTFFGKPYEIVKNKKAYRLSDSFINKIDEGFYLSDAFVHAANTTEAKKLFLDKIIGDGYERKDNEDFEYTDVRVVREYTSDIILLDGKEIKWEDAYKVYKHEEHQARIKAVEDNFSHAYIMKHGKYYRDNYRGYTEDINDAGVYTSKDARSHASSVEAITIVGIDIDSHNKRIEYQIEQLKKRIIEIREI